MSDTTARIGLYSNLYHLAKKRGVATYVTQLTQHMADLAPETRFNAMAEVFRPGERKQIPVIPQPNVSWRLFRLPGRVFESLTIHSDWPLLRILTRRLDLLHALQERMPLFRHGPAIMTVHGLAPIARPELYSEEYRREWISHLDRGLERADRIICVSGAVEKDLAQYRPEDASSYIAVPSGISSVFRDSGVEPEGEPVSRTKVFDFPYVLLVGAADPNKNLERFLRSYSIYLSGNPSGAPELVLIGERSWGGYDALETLIEELGISTRVHFTGFLEQSQLPAIYRSAELFVLPSFYEGFGLPLLEAMASGAPCLVSDIAVFHEIGMEFVEFFDPRSTDDMAARLEQVLNDSDRLSAMRSGGSNRAHQYTWWRTARDTLSVYEELLGTVLS